MADLTFSIPYYSGRPYLDRAIRSVLKQQDPRWRLNVCDGCGQEPDLEAFVESFHDRRIRYFPLLGPRGMAENWNRCLDVAETDLVTLLHADDELLEGYCGLMLQVADENQNAAAFFCEAKIIDAEGRGQFSFPDYMKRWLLPARGRRFVLQGEIAVRALLRGNFIMCPTLCYRKSRLGDQRFTPRWRQVLDLDLTLRLLMAGETLVGLPEVGYAYRRHASATTAQQTDNLVRFREEVCLYDELRPRLLSMGWRKAAILARRKWIIKLNLAYCLLRDLSGLQWNRAWRKWAFLHHGR